jgi:hypothetical protein
LFLKFNFKFADVTALASLDHLGTEHEDGRQPKDPPKRDHARFRPRASGNQVELKEMGFFSY